MGSCSGDPGMRVLVCGGRDFDSAEACNWLHKFALVDIGEAIGRYVPKIDAVIHGGASGAARKQRRLANIACKHD